MCRTRRLGTGCGASRRGRRCWRPGSGRWRWRWAPRRAWRGWRLTPRSGLWGPCVWWQRRSGRRRGRCGRWRRSSPAVGCWGVPRIDRGQSSAAVVSCLPCREDELEEADEVDNDTAEAIALHRWAVIAEAANTRLTPAERGAAVRVIAARAHAHPDGAERRYGRSTIDRWIRDWRAGGLVALRPQPRSDTGLVRAAPELFEEAVALRLELPTRSAAQIAEILWARHRVRVSARTLRDQLRRRGLHRQALAAEPKVFGRYEAARPNERWITDVLVDRWVPYPRTPASIRARLFVVVDDHSRLLVHGRFHPVENTRAGQQVLRSAIVRRGLPEVLYADQGAPLDNHTLARTCAVLGIRLVHSQPCSPEGHGKQERLNRYIRERFIAEAEHAGIEDLAELNDRFEAWAEQVANRRTHAETNQTPIDRVESGPPRAADPSRLREAFLWVATL